MRAPGPHTGQKKLTKYCSELKCKAKYKRPSLVFSKYMTSFLLRSTKIPLHKNIFHRMQHFIFYIGICGIIYTQSSVGIDDHIQVYILTPVLNLFFNQLKTRFFINLFRFKLLHFMSP